jgi:hypothetical protein
MKPAQLQGYRTLARAHRGNISSQIILTLCDEVESLQRCYGIALDVAYKNGKKRNIAIGQLRRQVALEQNNGA